MSGISLCIAKSRGISMDIISSLPEELSLEIFKLLNVEDLITCCTVSKTWRKVGNNNDLWKKLFLKGRYSTNILQFSSPLFEIFENLEPQCEWYQRFIREMRLLHHWKWGQFKMKVLKETYTDLLFMREGAIIIFVFQSYLKAYNIRDSYSEPIEIEGVYYDYKWSIAGKSDSCFVIQASQTIFLCYMCSKMQHPILKLTSKLNFTEHFAIKGDNMLCKCVGVIEDVVCIYIREESNIYFLAATNGEKLAVITTEFDYLHFTSQSHALYIYNTEILIEYDKNGKRRLQVSCIDDIIPPVQFYSNDSIIIADTTSPKEDIWFSPKVLQVWNRKNGKKMCRIIESIQTLLIHPSLPVFYYVPKLQKLNCIFKIVFFDAQKNCTIWETTPAAQSFSNVSVHLTLVRENFIFCILYKLLTSDSLIPYSSEQFLLDLENRNEYNYCVADHFQKLVWSNEQNLIFTSEYDNIWHTYVKIISFNYG